MNPGRDFPPSPRLTKLGAIFIIALLMLYIVGLAMIFRPLFERVL